jgi:hypothetical protein
MKRWHPSSHKLVIASLVLVVASVMTVSRFAQAANPGPESGSIGLQGTISSSPPSRAASIGIPANGAVFTSIPITVSGICPTGLLVKIFDNNVFVGSTVCTNGSFTLQIDLFSDQNQLIARVYDALDQAGPDSNTVTVTFNPAQPIRFGIQLTLSSPYAERGAPPGTELDWPILLDGGTGPYAISVDWGDGSPSDLLSVSTAGTITLKHTYKTSGLYRVIVKATDKNGEAAFLQVVGQATGAVQSNTKGSGSNVIVEKRVAWLLTAAMVPLIFAAFWIGRRYEHDKIRR